VSSPFQIPESVGHLGLPLDAHLCSDCGRECRLGDDQVRRHVSGWVRPRKRGVHGIELAEYDGQLLCGACTSRRKAGHSADQGQLL
jgi:hypothetical protein